MKTECHIISQLMTFALMTTFGETNFCHHFINNGLKIDYGFRRIRSTDPYETYISMNNMFWKLGFSERSDTKTIKLIDNQIDVSLMTKYQMSFCLYEGTGCTTGFVDKINQTIDWIRFSDSEGLDGNHSYVKTTNISFIDFDPSIAFVPNFGQKEGKYVYFLEQRLNENTKKFERKYRYYNFDEGLEGTDTTDAVISEDSPLVQRAIDSIDKDLNIIVIFGQFSEYEQSISGDGHGLVVITQNRYEMRYCYTQASRLNHMCNPIRLQELINCLEEEADHTGHSEEEAAIRSTAPPKGSEDNSTRNTVIIAIVLTVMPIMFFIIIGIFLFIRYKRNNSKTSNTDSDGKANKSDDKSESEVITIFKRKSID